MLPQTQNRNIANTFSGDGSRQCMFNLFVAQSLDEFNSFSDKKVTGYVICRKTEKILNAKSQPIASSFRFPLVGKSYGMGRIAPF